MQHFIHKNPEHMRIRAITYLLLFLLGLLLGGWAYYTYETWTSNWNMLIFPIYGILMFRLIRGVIMRCVQLENHVWKLLIHPKDKIVEIWAFQKWFELKKHTFALEELTAVIHKTNKPRLNFQLAKARHLYKTEGFAFLIWRYIIRRFLTSIARVFIFILNWVFTVELINYEKVVPTLPEELYDPRPTALSFVKGKNELSLIMLASYGWQPEHLSRVFDQVENLRIKVFDKRPIREQHDHVFL